MAFNPDEGEPVDTKFNPDLGEPVDSGFNPDEGEPVDVTEHIQSQPMSADELQKFYDVNPDLRDEMLRNAPSLPSVQAMSSDPMAQPKGATAKDALDAIWEGLTGKGSIVETGVPAAGKFAYEHPGTTGMLAISPFVPLSLAGVAGMAGLGTGAHIIDRVQQEQLYPTEAPINYREETVDALGAGVGSGLTHGVFTGIGKGAEAFAKPYLANLAKAAEIEADNARRAQMLERIKQNAPENAKIQDYIDAVENEGNPAFEAKLAQRRQQNEMARRQELRQQERHASPDEERLRRDRPELFYVEPEYIPYDPNVEYGKQQEAADILRGVKAMMRHNAKDFPEYQVGKVDLKGFGNYLVEPTDEAAARYLYELEHPVNPDMSDKGYELLRGFPLTQRGFNLLPRDRLGVIEALAGKSYLVPKMVDRLREPTMRFGSTISSPLGSRAGSILGSRVLEEYNR